MAETFRVLLLRSGKMQSSLEVKKENEGKLSVANSNEKYLYSRVVELEKRNQRLEKKVNKLKRKKKELKQEVLKLRAKIQVQGSEEVDKSTGQDEEQGVLKRTHCNILESLPLIPESPERSNKCRPYMVFGLTTCS